ncbi:MAG: hypothetical protein ABI867_27030 [Kofleriaceae bacterium]
MIAVWAIAGLVVGVVAARLLTGRAPVKIPVRHVLSLVTAADARAHTLAEIIEAMRAAAIRIERRTGGFDVIDQLDASGNTRIEVRVSDPQRVAVGSLAAETSRGGGQVFAIALVMVSLYGPLKLAMGDEVYDVDGTLDMHELTRELSRRQTARMKQLLAARSR